VGINHGGAAGAMVIVGRRGLSFPTLERNTFRPPALRGSLLDQVH
jgi:hypothetical protein